jgi:hypothetical protein
VIIKFVKDEHNRFKVTEPEELKGQFLPSGLVSAYEHEYEPRGVAGWVKVPTSLLAHGSITLVGIKEESWEEQRLREAREEFHRASGRVFGKTSGPSQEWVDGPEGFQLLIGGEKDQPLMPQDVKDVEDLTEEEELFEDFYQDAHSPENTSSTKPWEPDQDGCLWGAAAVLNAIGFVPRPNKNGSVHRWYHPVLGDDKADNHLLFDLETDSMQDLGIKIFRLGARLGTRALKLQIQNTIEQH